MADKDTSIERQTQHLNYVINKKTGKIQVRCIFLTFHSKDSEEHLLEVNDCQAHMERIRHPQTNKPLCERLVIDSGYITFKGKTYFSHGKPPLFYLNTQPEPILEFLK